MRRNLGWRSLKKSLTIFLLLGIAAGITLRFVGLGTQSLWADEMMTLDNALIGQKMTTSHVFGNLQGPLVSLMMHFWGGLSSSEAFLRIPFAVAGGLTVLSLFLLARLLSSWWVSLNTAFVASLSPILIWYSQEVRGYAFVVLFTVLMTYCFLRWLEAPRTEYLVLYGVSLFAGLASNLSAAFVAWAHFLFLVLLPSRRRLVGRWVVAVLVVLMLFSPWVRHIMVRVHPEKVLGADPGQPLKGGAQFSAMAIPYAFFTYSVGYSLGPPVRDLQIRRAQTLRENATWIALSIAVFAILAVLGLRKWAGDDLETLTLILLSVVIPLLAVSALVIRHVKVFTPRYALVSVPAYLLLVGRGLAEISRSKLWIFLVIFTGVVGFSIFNHFTNPAYKKDDARGAAETIRRGFQDGDVVVGVFSVRPLRHYLEGVATVQTFEAGHLASQEARQERCRQLAVGAKRIWLSLCREWTVDPEGSIKGWFDSNMVAAKKFDFPGIRLYLYQDRSG